MKKVWDWRDKLEKRKKKYLQKAGGCSWAAQAAQLDVLVFIEGSLQKKKKNNHAFIHEKNKQFLIGRGKKHQQHGYNHNQIVVVNNDFQGPM